MISKKTHRATVASIILFSVLLAAFWIYKTTPTDRTIMLSFDVEPVDGGESPILLADVLDKYHINATFFITGDYAEKYPDTVKRLAAYDIGCHSYSHPKMTDLTLEEQREEIKKSKAAIEKIIGREITGYRAPYNLINKDTFTVLQELGFEYDASIIDGWSIFYSKPPSDIKEITVSSYFGMPMEDVSWIYFTGGIGKDAFFNLIMSLREEQSYLFHPRQIIQEKDKLERTIAYLKARNAKFISHS